MEEELSHWQLIHEISLTEAASLILGVEPATPNVMRVEQSRITVYARAIGDAVQRANQLAWQSAKQLDRLMLYSEENAKAIAEHISVLDIWKYSQTPQHFLPSLEIRHSLASVFGDPNNVPILLPVDPWYTATVHAGELNRWIQDNNIKSAYTFTDEQKVLVTTHLDNWNSQQGPDPISEQDSPAIEGVRRFSEEIEPGDRTLGSKERNTLLTIIALLCKDAGCDYTKAAKTAASIKNTAASMGVTIGETTIEGHLKKIPDALGTRMK